MALTKIGPKYQITIPKSAREAIRLRVGDYMDAAIRKDGILLRPKKVVDRSIDIDKRLQEAEEDII